MRLSTSSLAGTARTLVAVGTVRLVSMLATTRAAAPRSGWVCSTVVAARPSDFAGAGWSVFWAAVRALGVVPLRVVPLWVVPLWVVPLWVLPPWVLPLGAVLPVAGPPAAVLGWPVPVPVPVVRVSTAESVGAVSVGAVSVAGVVAAGPVSGAPAAGGPVRVAASGPADAGVVFGGAEVALASASAAGDGSVAPLPPSGNTLRWSLGCGEPALSGE